MLLHYLVILQCFKNRIIEVRCFEVFLRMYLLGCLISFSRQISVNKNYNISVRIKYSVRDLIYDSHICA